MKEVQQFMAGDRVRVDPGYWVAEAAGRSGTVSAYPEGTTPQRGCVWVEFDVAEARQGTLLGAEVDVENLRRL